MYALLKQKISKLRYNRDMSNVFYSIVPYFITPIVMFVSTPLLLKHLGAANYGLWILINSMAMVMTFSNFGLGNALIKLGSECVSENEENKHKFMRLFGVTFSISLIVSGFILLIVVLFGPYLIEIFIHGQTDSNMLELTRLLGGITALRIINSVVTGIYMAKQRHDLNSKVNVLVNLLSSMSYIILAVFDAKINSLVATLLLFSFIQVVLNAIIAKRVVPGIRFVFSLDRETVKKVLSYGFYSWMQALNSTLIGQVDKLMIGGMLGLTTLGYYTLCTQLIFKIHEIPATATSYLLAKFSTLYEAGDQERIRKVYRQALTYKSLFIISSSVFLLVFARKILILWIGLEFANQHEMFFRILVVGVAIYAFSIIPYYCLNGTGFVKVNTIVAFIVSLVTLGLLSLLLPFIGLYGVAVGKMASLPLVLFLLHFVENNVFNETSFATQQKLRGAH